MPLPTRLYSGVRVTNSPCLPNVRRLDGAIIPMVNRMMRNGIAVDINGGKDGPCLMDLSTKLERLKAEEYTNIQYCIPADALHRFVSATSDRESVDDEDLLDAAESINLNSPDQLATLLYEHMGLGEGANVKKTKGGQRFSTGKKQLEALRSDDRPIIAAILRYREYAKLKSTIDSLPKLARWCERTKTWRLHTQLLTTRTDTGRLASKNPNLQNVSAKSDLGKEFRACFMSSPGCALLSRDYSQIELRVLAHLGNVTNMLDVFARDGDIHDATTQALYGISQQEWEAMAATARKDMRAPVKNINFGVVYGLSALGLQQSLFINKPPIIWTVQQCEDFIAQWYALYPGVQAYMQDVYMNARRYGMVWTMFGRFRLIPGIRSIHTWIQAAALREAGNQPVQGTAADLLKIAMAQIEDETAVAFRPNGIYVEPLLQVHDELIWDVDERYVDGVSEYFGEIMDNVVKLRCPLKSEASVGTRWRK